LPSIRPHRNQHRPNGDSVCQPTDCRNGSAPPSAVAVADDRRWPTARDGQDHQQPAGLRADRPGREVAQVVLARLHADRRPVTPIDSVTLSDGGRSRRTLTKPPARLTAGYRSEPVQSRSGYSVRHQDRPACRAEVLAVPGAGATEPSPDGTAWGAGGGFPFGREHADDVKPQPLPGARSPGFGVGPRILRRLC